PFNGGNCPGCRSVGSENEFVYDPNSYSYNETPNFFNQPPQHQFKTYSCDSCAASILFIEFCCEYCEGLHDSYDCQSNNQVFDEPYSYNDFESYGFDQPLQYPIDQSPLHDDMSLHEMLIRSAAYLEESTKRHKQSFDEFKILYDNFWSEMKRNKMMNINAQITKPSVDYFDDKDNDDTMVTIILPPAIVLPLPLLTIMKPADTLLMGDKDSSTTPAKETDQFIESEGDVSLLPSSPHIGKGFQTNYGLNKEVKNGIEKPIERRTRIIESLQNFRVIHKRSISLNNTSQISLVHAIAHILSTEEPEYSLSMGYEHLSTTLETESDEVTESSAKNLLPILSECEVTLDNESESGKPIKDDSSVFATFSNPLCNDSDDLTSN
nr:hypothetical protein [Tanacetum cinerariifolium]